ncbi:MAG: histidine kinase [Phototrophicales bacterium]|nr:MAG: histidine kinase [Phototrophicales bacterium]
MLAKYQKLSLGAKFTLILLGIFVVGMTIGGIVIYQLAQQVAERSITNRSEAMLDTMNAVRTYTSTHVNPELADRLMTEAEFIPETVPAYSARTVFETFRQQENYAHYSYKEATLNPTNPQDRADQFESDLVSQFHADDSLDEITGYREIDGERVYFIAHPMRVTSETCLNCHGSPENAPPSLLNTYGDQNGFGWQLGEIVAAQVIYVPAGDVLNGTRQVFFAAMGIFTVIFGVAIIMLNRLLRPTVLTPIATISALAEQLGRGNDETREITLSELSARGDEVGSMARVFQRMAENVRKRERELKSEVQQLRVVIDQEKRQREVEQIADTDYFRTLQSKAAQLRERLNNPPTSGD